MKKIQGLWRGEGRTGILHSLLQNLKKPQIWKLNMDINRGGYREKTELEKMPLEKTTISHPKTPNNTKTSNNTWRQLKAPENNSRWRWTENTSTWRRVEYGEERKIWGKSAKNGENNYPTRLWRMSGEDTKLGGEKGKRGREQEGKQLPGSAMEDDWRR